MAAPSQSRSSKPKRFRLSLVNAAEDVPRLIRAYGRACMGEFALVLRPREQRGVLVLMTKAEGARVWQVKGEGEGEGDAPGVPEVPIAAEDAVKLVKVEQKALPKAGPITLRGQWSGYLHCEEGAPRVELRRKLATYGVLHLESVAGQGWTWKVERTEKWFSEPGADEGEAVTLLGAIEAGLRQAMGLLGEACSLRDSRRRSAFDPGWAEKYPIKPAREGKDPTERLKVKPPPKRRGKKAPPPAPVDAPVSLPDVPATPAAMQRMEQEVTAEADALSDLRGLRWVWADSGVREDVAGWFDAQGLGHLGDQVRAYDGSPDQPLDAFIEGLKDDVRGEGLAAEAQQQALARVDQLRAGWLEAPQLMERARRLIRYAAVMADSKLCRGKEKREAAEAIQRAVQAYDDAREAIAAGRAVDGQRTLRRIGERVALSAAKSARSCAQGQQSLTAIASGAAAVRSLAAAGGWKVGDRFVAGSRSGVVIDVPQAGARVVDVRWDVPIDVGRGETVTESRLRTDELRDPATGRARPQQVAPPVRAAGAPGGVDSTTVPGLTIVDVGTVPTTSDELRALTAGHAEAFTADPKASTAKKWVKSALLHLGLEAANLSAKTRRFDDLGGGRRVFVTVLLPASAEGEATDARLRLLSEAAPRGLSIEDWDYAEAGAQRASRGRGAAVATPRVVSAPPADPVAEGEVDAEKDKALLDAFSAAIAAAMREAG